MKPARLILLVLAVLASAAVAAPLTSAEMQEDFRFLRDVWSRTDQSLSAERRPLFEKVVAEAIARAPRLTPAEFTLEVSRAVAVAGNGHSEAQLGPHLRGLPVGLAWFSDGLFVIRTEPRYSGLLGARVEKFGSLTTEEAVAKISAYAVVDLRLNHGGDFFNTVSFAYALPRMIPAAGKIFVLVGPDTFSAALVTAAMLKGHGGALVVLVGEPMGDDAIFWAEGQGLTLPNSKLVVGTATKKQDWGARCTDTAGCYWGNIAFGFEKVSLEPEIKVATTFAEYAAGRDTVLEAVLSKTAAAADGGVP